MCTDPQGNDTTYQLQGLVNRNETISILSPISQYHATSAIAPSMGTSSSPDAGKLSAKDIIDILNETLDIIAEDELW